MNRSRSVLAVRHCESTGQEPEAVLSARGRAQAETLAAKLRDQPIASPYLRARQTIAPLAAQRGLHIDTDERLAERRLSPRPIDDWLDHVARSFEDLDARASGGESGREAQLRGWAALGDALETPNTLLVSHGQLLALVLRRIDSRFGFSGWRAMSNPDVFRIFGAPGETLVFERLWSD